MHLKLPRQVTLFLETKIKEFWQVPCHLPVVKEAVAVGKLFGTHLYLHSTFESKRAGYIYSIDEDMQFCLPHLLNLLVLAKYLMLLPGQMKKLLGSIF